MEIKMKKVAKKGAPRFGEFEDRKRAARRQNSAELPQSGRIVREVAESKCTGHQIECAIRKRKRQCVCFYEFERAMSTGGDFLARANDHRMREIGTDE